MYAIQLFHCIDFVPLYVFTECTEIKYISEEDEQWLYIYQEEIRVEKLCSHVHNSVEEFLTMSPCVTSLSRLSYRDPLIMS